MNKKNMSTKAGMFINIPSDLRGTNIDELEKKNIDHTLQTWEFLTTPRYRMEVDTKRQVKLISNLHDIVIIDLSDYMYREFKNVLNLYSKGYWLAAVSTVGVICEYLTKVFIPRKNSLQRQKGLGQKDRIRTLSDYLDKDEKNLLIRINEKRNDCLHLDVLEIEDLKGKATEITNMLINLMVKISDKYFWEDSKMSGMGSSEE